MLFCKQHLKYFISFAFLLTQINAGPLSDSLSNEAKVERLRGDLHQFIEMIISCLSNVHSSNHHGVDSSKMQQFSKITNNLQQDIGFSPEVNTEEVTDVNFRKFSDSASADEVTTSNDDEDVAKESDTKKETSEETRKVSDISKELKAGESTQENEEKENTETFDLQEGDEHAYTPKTTSTPDVNEVTESSSTEKTSTISQNDSVDTEADQIGLRMLVKTPESTTDLPENDQSTTMNMKTPMEMKKSDEKTPISKENDKSSEESPEPLNIGELIAIHLKKTLQPLIEKMQSSTGLKSSIEKALLNIDLQPSTEKTISDISAQSSIEKMPTSSHSSFRKSNPETTSNEYNDDTNNNEEIQVRNLVKPESPQYVSDSSVHPYDALHIYGVQEDGPINKIVFEGGAHHPPRPLTIKESNHLKEFIRMVLYTNKLQYPHASFSQEEEAVQRIGSSSTHQSKKSPWASKPVPLELV